MLHLIARDIINCSEEKIWLLDNVSNCTIVFDDGEIITTGRRTLLSWYYWRCLAKFPNTALLKRHHLGTRKINKDTLRDLMGNVFDIMDMYGEEIKEDLMEEAFAMINHIYNVFTTQLTRYVRSISAFDLVDALFNPTIAAANANVKPNEASIKKTREIIKDTLLNDSSLQHTALSINLNNGSVKAEQTITLVGPIGYREEINGNIFSNPILRGYGMGMQKLQDAMIESRSAAKALIYAEAPLQDSEYFNRRLQLVCQIVERLHVGDCGSTEYLEWHVHKSDLKLIAGQYYYSETGLKPIRANDNHLVGRLIKMRNVLFCNHLDQNGACSKCYGELAYSIPYRTNIGHVAATTLGEKGSQFIMSIKHHDGTSAALGIDLSPEDRLFIEGEDNATVLYLSQQRKNKSTKLVIARSEAPNLTLVAQRPDKIDLLNIFNITQLENVKFISEFMGIEEPTIIPVSIGSRKSALSTEMLQYLATNSWGVTPNGDYCIDLCNWDITEPMFILPKKQMGVVEFIGTVKTKLIGADTKDTRSKGVKSRIDNKPLYLYNDPVEALKDLYTLVNSTLDVNIVHLSTILLAMTIRDPINKDYNMPLPGEPLIFGKYNEILERRSLSVKMAYEGQYNAMFDTVNYLQTNRPAHVKDEALMPQVLQ